MAEIENRTALNTIKEFLQIDDANRKLGFLVGSGISTIPPSNLPSGQELAKAIIEASVVDDAKLDLLELTDAFRPGLINNNDFIRFERLVEITHKWLDPDLHFLRSLKYVGSPNRLHRLIARQLINGNLVFTTNFDNLIEKALKTYSADFELISTRNEAKAFRDKLSLKPEIVLEDFQNVIFKLHGTFFDKNGNDVQHTIKSTLDNLLEGGGFLGLGSDYDFIFEKALQHTNLVVIGYSGFDDFDVMPALRSISSLQRILWINHRPGNDISIFNSKNIREFGRHVINNANYHSRDIHQIMRLFLLFDYPSNTSTMIVQANTEQLLAELLGEDLTDDFHAHTTDVTPKSLFPENVVKEEALKYLVTGRLYHDTQRYKEAIQYYEKFFQQLTVLSITESLEQEVLQLYAGIAYLYAGMAQARLGINSAELNINDSVKIFSKLHNDYYLARAMQWQGAYMDDNQAIEHYKRLLEMVTLKKDEAMIAQTYHQLGSFEEDKEQSILFYKQALELRRKIGDLYGIASTSKQLGAICLDTHPQQARIYLEESVKIFYALGYSYDSLEPLILSYYLLAHNLKERNSSYNVILDIASLLNKSDVRNRLTNQDKEDLQALAFVQDPKTGLWLHRYLRH